MASCAEYWDCTSDTEQGEIDELEAANDQGAVNGTSLDEESGEQENNPAHEAVMEDPDRGDELNMLEDNEETDAICRGLDDDDCMPPQKRRKKADPLKDWDPAILYGALIYVLRLHVL